MRELIESNPEILAAYNSGDDATVISLLNAEDQKELYQYKDQPAGYQTNASVGDILGSDALGTLLVVIKDAIENQPATPEGAAFAEVLSSMLSRFSTTTSGVNFANEEVRQNISDICIAANVVPQPYLDLGYTMVALADPPAVQSDIDELRAEDLFNSYTDFMEEKAANAQALFNARWQAAATADPPVYWDDNTKASEWAAAWSES